MAVGGLIFLAHSVRVRKHALLVNDDFVMRGIIRPRATNTDDEVAAGDRGPSGDTNQGRRKRGARRGWQRRAWAEELTPQKRAMAWGRLGVIGQGQGRGRRLRMFGEHKKKGRAARGGGNHQEEGELRSKRRLISSWRPRQRSR